MDVLYIWGDDTAAIDAAVAAHLDGTTVCDLDLAVDGLDGLERAARSAGLFGTVGVRARAASLRAGDAAALSRACVPGTRVALLAERAAPGWLRTALAGRCEVHDASVPRGQGFVAWVRAAGADAGIRLDGPAAAVIAAAASGSAARARSLLWVCRVGGVTEPTASQLGRLTAAWGAAPNAFAAVDHALGGDHSAALRAADDTAAGSVAAALRTAANRLGSLVDGDGEPVPRFARRALESGRRRGVTPGLLRDAAVSVELATRGLGGDSGAVVDAELTRIATASR
jgi:hypothetical protein